MFLQACKKAWTAVSSSLPDQSLQPAQRHGISNPYMDRLACRGKACKKASDTPRFEPLQGLKDQHPLLRIPGGLPEYRVRHH